VPKIGRPEKPVEGDRLDTSIFTPSETSSLWCVRGVMSMFTPTLRYEYEVMGCWFTPPAAMGEKVTCGTGTSSPNLACAGRPSEVRSGGLAGVRVFVSRLRSR